MRTPLFVLAALGAALALPSAASAAYSLGNHPDGILEGTSTTCAGGCTIVQDWAANEQLRVPGWLGEHAVVVGWRVRGGGGQARLQRVSVAGGAASALAATDAVGLTGVKQEVAAGLPVRAGDALGLALTPGASVDSVDLGFGESTLTYTPALDGTPRAGVETEGAAIAFEADLEPDADADGLGDETQDPCVGDCTPAPTPTPTPPVPEPTPTATPTPDATPPAGGPKATIAREAVKKGSKVTVTVSNPYAFTVSGKLQLKRGKKVVAKTKLKLGANATRSITLKVRRPGRSLTVATTLRGPAGKQRTTTAKVKLTTGKPGKSGGIDGTYRGGTGAGADWVMVIAGGVVTNFNGSISTYCTKAGKQQNHSFAMIGDDPDPKVSPTGAFAWEATTGYGFDKLKFDGVVKGNTITGKMMVESRPPINGVSPVTGLPRIEFEYCFAGRDFTLTKG
jgi:hypothetical protein